MSSRIWHLYLAKQNIKRKQKEQDSKRKQRKWLEPCCIIKRILINIPGLDEMRILSNQIKALLMH